MCPRINTYPARPVNGGPLDKASPKTGDWFYEPKFNGWRAFGHVPTGAMFNRKGEPLSIASEFAQAFKVLRESIHRDYMDVFQWLDCEALERRHNIARGSLIILDVPGLSRMTLRQRRDEMVSKINIKTFVPEVMPDVPNTAFLTPSYLLDRKDALQLYNDLMEQNRHLGLTKPANYFYEGVVAKRADSIYPIQLRSPEIEFPYWTKHRYDY